MATSTVTRELLVNENTPLPIQPPPPDPSTDVVVIVNHASPQGDKTLSEDHKIDIFTLSPMVALKMISVSLEALALLTGDTPATPPVSLPSTPGQGGIQGEVVGVHEESDNDATGEGNSPRANADVDSNVSRKTAIIVPQTRATHHPPIIGGNTESVAVQRSAIARKFYSKKPPPIPLEEYLDRLHRYCPMSTAVFLAASLYIHRMALAERLLPITQRNVHRLLLAALRIAMKALEDLSYPHSRFAKVGGVSELELGRLEVSFCFLTNFELKVSQEMLGEHATSLRSASLLETTSNLQPKLPLGRKKAQKS